jgi:hypothetical protein
VLGFDLVCLSESRTCQRCQCETVCRGCWFASAAAERVACGRQLAGRPLRASHARFGLLYLVAHCQLCAAENSWSALQADVLFCKGPVCKHRPHVVLYFFCVVSCQYCLSVPQHRNVQGTVRHTAVTKRHQLVHWDCWRQEPCHQEPCLNSL